MLAKLKKFSALGAAEKTLYIHAWLYLGWMRAAILATSFKHLAAPLEHYREAVNPPTVAPDQLTVAAQTGRLVAAAARYTPWQSRCLVQVLVTQRLLARRGIPGQFCLGVCGGSEAVASTRDPADFAAHAWLQCGDQVVNGAAGHERFNVVSTFRWAGREPARSGAESGQG
mgnify:FL=1